MNEKENDELEENQEVENKEKQENTEIQDDEEERMKELIDLVNQVSGEKKDKMRVTVVFGFLLHPNKFIHLLLSFIISMVVTVVVIGYFQKVNYPIIEYSNFGFLVISVLIFTILEYLVKVFIMNFFPKLMLYSFGLIFFVCYFMIYGLINIGLGDKYSFISSEKMIVYVFSFSIIRLILSVYLRRMFVKRAINRMRVKK